MTALKLPEKVLNFQAPNDRLNTQVGRGGARRKKEHPIDQRLAQLGKTRAWLAKQVERSPQTIGLYCNRKVSINPNSLVARRICRVLEVDLNYLILGRATLMYRK